MSPKISKKIVIDKAAMELFVGKGFAATTIKDIAQMAGVTEGALYRHYESKATLAQKLFEAELNNVSGQLFTAFQGEEQPVQKLRAVAATLYTIYQNRPWPLLFVILNFQTLKSGPLSPTHNSLYDLIIKYSLELLPNDTPNHVRELLPAVFNGMLVQPVIYHYYGKLPRHPMAYVDEITANCCNLLGLHTSVCPGDALLQVTDPPPGVV